MANKLKTKCPHCQTKFNISEGHLDKAKGLVRCGACLKIFDASKHISIDAQFTKSNATKLRESRFDDVEIEDNTKVKFKHKSQQDFSRKLPTEKTKDKISDAPVGPRLDDDGKPTFPHMGETQLKTSGTSAPEVQKQPETPKQTEAPKQPELEKNTEPTPTQFKTPQKSQSSSAKSSLKKGSADDWVMDLIHEFEQDRHSQGTPTEGNAVDSAPSFSDTKEAQPNKNSASPLSISAANEPSEPKLESDSKSLDTVAQKPSSGGEKRPEQPASNSDSKAKKPLQIIAANEIEEPEEHFDDDSELSSLHSSDSTDPSSSTELETAQDEPATSQSPESMAEPEPPALEIIDDEGQVAGRPSEKLDLEDQKLSTKKVEHFIAEEPSSDEIIEAKAMLEKARTEALINDLQRPMEMDTESSNQPLAAHDQADEPQIGNRDAIAQHQKAQEQQTPEQSTITDISPAIAPTHAEVSVSTHDNTGSSDSDTSIESANTAEYRQQEFALQEEHALKQETAVEEISLLGDDKNFPTKWVALSALAVVLLPLLYLVFNFNDLANHPDYRPMMAKICSIGLCELPPYQNIAAIHMKGVVISPSPNRPELLNFGAIITNQAGLDQPFPAIQMVFTDRHNRIVQTLVMQPEQYLTGELTQLEQLPSRTHVQIQTSFPYNAVLYSYQVSLVPATSP
ncbi:MAG: DUF3426 domain-containing protein [Pseudomonadota bacterium]|nr:DUF3426 domain-containing protein [Pseudomonadota bacterium]